MSLSNTIKHHLNKMLNNVNTMHNIFNVEKRQFFNKFRKASFGTIKNMRNKRNINRCLLIGSPKNKIRIAYNHSKSFNQLKLFNYQTCKRKTQNNISIQNVIQILIVYYLIQIEVHEISAFNYHNDMQQAVFDKISKVYQTWHNLEFGWLSIIINYHTMHTMVVHYSDTIEDLINKISSNICFKSASQFYITFQNQCFHIKQSNKIKLTIKDLLMTHNSIIHVMDSLPGGTRDNNQSYKRELDPPSSEEEDLQPTKKKRKLDQIVRNAPVQTMEVDIEEEYEAFRSFMSSQSNENAINTESVMPEDDEQKYDAEELHNSIDDEYYNHLIDKTDIHKGYESEMEYYETHFYNNDVQCNHNHNPGTNCSYCRNNLNTCDDMNLFFQTLNEENDLYSADMNEYFSNLSNDNTNEINTTNSMTQQESFSNDLTVTSANEHDNQQNSSVTNKKRKYHPPKRRGRKPKKELVFKKQNREYNAKMEKRNMRRNAYNMESESWMSKLYYNKIKKSAKTPKFKMSGGIDKFRSHLKRYKENYIGKMDQECPYCGALLFKSELSDKKTGEWNICCKNGKIKLKPPLTPPEELHYLFTNDDPLAKYFQQNIVMLNNALAMSSSQIFRKKLPHSHGRAPPTFILSGAVYHTVPRLLPESNHSPKQAQIYTWDPEEEFNHRINQGFLGKITREPKFRQLIKELQSVLHEHNWIVKMYKSIFEQYFDGANTLPELKLILHTKVSDKTNLGHYKTFSKPNENSPIATLIEFSDLTDPVPMHRKLILTTRQKDENRTLLDCHALSDALAFPLLYPYGECGYDMDYKNINGDKITMTQYYRYRLMERKNEWNPFIHGQRLFQKFISATWAKIQQNTMNWYINNQKQCRADSYESISKARKKNKQLEELGTKLNILPRSFIESPRYFRSKYQNAMAILRRMGSIPDFFITFTANQNWREIHETMEMHETSLSCRDDVIARVFRAKLKQFLHDITQLNGLGV